MATERVINCDPKTHNFLTAAIAEGAHSMSPDPRYAEAWIRQRIFIFSYYGTSATLEQLAGIYGLKSRERVSQIIEAGITRLWRNCSPGLQQRFPLKEIPKGKPWTIERSLRLSEARGGAIAEVYRGLQGEKTVDEITRDSLRGRWPIDAARKTLGRFGIEVPYQNQRNNAANLTALSDEEAKDLGVQEALNKITFPFLNHHVRRPDSPILSLSTIVLDSTGQHFKRRLRQLTEGLREMGIPVAVIERPVGQGSERVIQRYYIVARQHRARIEAALVRLSVLEQDKK